MAKVEPIEIPVTVSIKSMIGDDTTEVESPIREQITEVIGYMLIIGFDLDPPVENKARASIEKLFQMVEDLEDVLANTQEELSMANAYIAELRAQPGFVEIPE